MLDEVSEGVRPTGVAQKWWMHHSLTSLGKDIANLGGQLLLRAGPATEIIDTLMQEAVAAQICWNRRYGEGEQTVDRQIKARYGDGAKSFGGMLLHEPNLIRTGSDMPYKVYTMFWKKLSAGPPPRLPLPRSEKLTCHQSPLASDYLDTWRLLPTKPDWSDTISEQWQPGEADADLQLVRFTAENINGYGTNRDFPGPYRTSCISPHLRFSEISPYQLWHASYPANPENLDKTALGARDLAQGTGVAGILLSPVARMAASGEREF